MRALRENSSTFVSNQGSPPAVPWYHVNVDIQETVLRSGSDKVGTVRTKGLRSSKPGEIVQVQLLHINFFGVFLKIDKFFGLVSPYYHELRSSYAVSSRRSGDFPVAAV